MMNPMKGLKPTSNLVSISGYTAETAANTFSTETASIDLDPLNQEVFVITSVAIDIDEADLVADTTTLVDASLTKTRVTAVGGINQDTCIASSRTSIVLGQIGFSRDAPNLSASMDDYVTILSTSDFYANIKGANNGNLKSFRWRVYGFRARVTDPGVYAALVQSEALSANI